MNPDPEDGTYYLTKTLIGGEPDCNRRHLHCWPSEITIAVFHPTGRGDLGNEWTDFDNRRANAIVSMLNNESRFDAPRPTISQIRAKYLDPAKPMTTKED